MCVFKIINALAGNITLEFTNHKTTLLPLVVGSGCNWWFV